MTVSNAYNRPDQLSPALREKILETARELGYGGPDPVARTLKRGATGSVGVVLDYPLTTAFTDPATVRVHAGHAAGWEEAARGMSLVPRIEVATRCSWARRWSTASSPTACRRGTCAGRHQRPRGFRHARRLQARPLLLPQR